MTVDSNYTRQADTFRAKAPSGSNPKIPLTLIGPHTRSYKGNPQVVTVTDNAVHNLTVPVGADFAEIYFQGASLTSDYVRFWHGATDPTASQGQIMTDGDTYISGSPSTITFIKGASGGGGTLMVEYFSYE